MRGLCVALLIIGWSMSAIAATTITMTPNPVDTPVTTIGTPSSADGTLSASANAKVDLVVSGCNNALGTFTLNPDTNVNLNGGATPTITVTYTPVAGGTQTCTVHVYDTGTTTSLGMFSVRGTGVKPATMSISGNTDFSSVRYNDAAPVHTFSRTFTVSNTGDQTLTVTNVSVTGDFAVTGVPASGSILGGGSKSWTITFDPSAGGTRTGTLTFTSDAPANGTQSLTVMGVGTNAVIAVSDPAFGIVNIGNSANQDITVTNNGGAPKGPLGVTSAAISGGGGWFTFSACGGGTTCTFAPALAINTSTVVGVKCTPPLTAAANDMQTAMVTFTSDTDSATDTVALATCTAGQSKLATNMTTVQFAPTLVGTTSTPLMVTVTNTGNVDATIWLSKTGANAGAFTVGTSSGCGTASTNVCTVLANNGTQMINVNVTPGFEGDVSAGLTLNANAPPNPTLVLAGRGIDRHVSTVDSVQFPDTFRNPGDKASVMPIAVKNIGEYPLHVSNVALDGQGTWALADTFMPFDVPGLSEVAVNVVFTPMTAGKAPDATLVVFTDDTKKPQSNIVISGNGKDRNVAMGPPVLDFGNTGAGVPVTYTSLKRPDDWLTVVNMDDTAFKVREITFDMPDLFKVEAIGGGGVAGDLAVGARNQYEVVFTPPKVGEYTANMTLFLDQDPLGQRTIEVRGNALFVDAHGGGGFGCSAGNGAGGGAALALLALVRRKRPRARA